MKLILRTSGSRHVAKTSCQENGCSCGWGWSSPHLCWLHAGLPYGCAQTVQRRHNWMRVQSSMCQLWQDLRRGNWKEIGCKATGAQERSVIENQQSFYQESTHRQPHRAQSSSAQLSHTLAPGRLLLQDPKPGIIFQRTYVRSTLSMPLKLHWRHSCSVD